MVLNVKLDVSLRQKLVLTPSLQQAIKLLQLNRIELEQEILQELLQNPTLEESNSESEDNNSSEDELDTKKSEEKNPEDDEIQNDTTVNPMDDVEWDRYFQNDDINERQNKSYDFSDFVPADNFVNKKNSLNEHLKEQIGLTHLQLEDREIVEKIIEYIDEDGYITLDEISISDELGIPINKVLDLIEVIQELDPAGIGARSLKECLSIQLIVLRREFINSYRSIGIFKEDIDNAEKIIDGYLPFLESKNYAEIRKNLNLDDEQIEKAIKVISGLEPKPGRQFYPESTVYIVPDVFVIEDNGEYIILLNDDGIPKLKLSEFYTNIAKKKITVSHETKKFIDHKINSAVWFIKSIEQRKQTILNVAKKIVEIQKDFFKIGTEGLKPMTLLDISIQLEIHESTVSRVVHNKYMHTPQGIFEMKYFFHRGFKTDHGDNISTVIIKNMIKNLIQSEKQDKPLNDRTIADLFKEKGIEIARRTVAKYRENLNILSCNLRRKEYKRSKIL
jgi:RNA polymerase sigma-54 factor